MNVRETGHPFTRPAEHRLLGIALRSLAMLAFACMMALAKLAVERGANPLELLFYRSLFGIPVLLAWLALGPGLAAVRTRRPLAHATRTGIGLVSLALNFVAISMLPLAEAVTIGFAAPLFATILSALILAEPVGARRWAAVALGMVGVVIVMRPGGHDLPPLGVAIAVAGALTMATTTITIRQIGATENPAATVFWFTMLSTLLSAAVLPSVASWNTLDHWPLLVGIGTCGCLVQITATISLRYAPVSVLVPFDYLQLIWATALGWLIWSDVPPATTFAGGLLIAGSGIYTAWREHRRHIDTTAATPPAI